MARNRQVVLGAAAFALIVASALCAPALPLDPNRGDMTQVLRPPIGGGNGTWAHPLGTDSLGRDLLTRIVYGARTSLIICCTADLLALLLGCTVGLLAVFVPRLNRMLMRLVDLQMAFPYVILALTIAAVAKPSDTVLIVLLMLAGWPLFARVVRASALQEAGKDYVLAARALGASKVRIALRYVMPNIVPILLVLGLNELGAMILFEATLSFLGIGIQPPRASWGSILFEGRAYLPVAWWIATLPGLAISVATLGLNLLSEGLRDVYDPRLRQAR